MLIIELQMAFMAMRKNLDDRARKKGLDSIFNKFDRNQNGKKLLVINATHGILYIMTGKIFIKDLVSSLLEQGHKVGEDEVRKLRSLADCDGQVCSMSGVLVLQGCIIAADQGRV